MRINSAQWIESRGLTELELFVASPSGLARTRVSGLPLPWSRSGNGEDAE